MVTLCTLFDSHYLDKGLALYDSLCNTCHNFQLYVLSMDDKCYDVLTSLNLNNLFPVSLSEFEDEELNKIKQNRTPAEYCWTCTPAFTEYVLLKHRPDICTYIDADIYFYKSPEVLLNELDERNASVLLVNHRYCKYDQRRIAISGRFCVEFNSFKNDENGRSLLSLWKKQCFECCSKLYDGVHFADQKYLDNWTDDYPYAIETQNDGAGVAPWNLPDYRMISAGKDGIKLSYRRKTCELIFYHFEKIKYLGDGRVDIGVYNRWGVSNDVVRSVYPNYLKHIEEKKGLLKRQFNFEYSQSEYPGLAKGSSSGLPLTKRFFNILQHFSFGIFFNEWLPMRLNHKKNIIQI